MRNFKKSIFCIGTVFIIFIVVLLMRFIPNGSFADDSFHDEANKPSSMEEDVSKDNTIRTELTIEDVRELAKIGDELKFKDFTNFKGLDTSSNTNVHIMIYSVEGGYRLVVHTNGEQIESANLESIWEQGGSGIDIRYNDVEEFVKSHPSHDTTVKGKNDNITSSLEN